MSVNSFNTVFEALLRQAIVDNLYELAASVPPNEVLDTMFTVSERHDKCMRKLCAREDRREQIHGIMKPIRKIAVAAVVAIVILFGALMLNSDVRAVVAEVIIEWYGQFTRFIGAGENAPAESNDWSPTYLPDGYKEVSLFIGDHTKVEYEDENGTLLIFKFSPDDNDLRIDNEETEYTEEKIDGITYYVFTADAERKPNKITWFYMGYSFYLSGYIGTEILLNIATSTK